MAKSDQDVREMTIEFAQHALELSRELRSIKTKGVYPDGYHKQVGDQIGAINAGRAAIQTSLMQQALVMRAMDMPDGDSVLKLLKPKVSGD